MSIFFGIPAPTVAAWMTVAVSVVLLGLLLFAAVNRVLLKMALRNIPRRRAQTVLILFGLMLATLIITASLSVGDTLNYSLAAIQLRQTGGIDEAFTRHQPQSVQGASTAATEFFSENQAADVIARSKKDANVASAIGVIVSSGSMIDTTTSQSSSENVSVFGVPPDFGGAWGQLRSSAGASLDVAALAPDEVYVGNQLGDALNAHAGDRLQLYVDGNAKLVTIRGVLDTEVDPSIAGHGPIVNSVLMPLATMRAVMQIPNGYNIIFVHNRGTDGFDDLGPGGATGDEVTKHFRVEFTDPQAPADLWAYLSTPAINAQVKKIHDQASFLDPTQDLSRRLLLELNQPAVTDEFKALAGDRLVERVMGDAVAATVGPAAGVQAAHTAAGQADPVGGRPAGRQHRCDRDEGPAGPARRSWPSHFAGGFASGGRGHENADGPLLRGRPSGGYTQVQGNRRRPRLPGPDGTGDRSSCTHRAGPLQRHRRPARPLRLLGVQGGRRDLRAAWRRVHHRGASWRQLLFDRRGRAPHLPHLRHAGR